MTVEVNVEGDACKAEGGDRETAGGGKRRKGGAAGKRVRCRNVCCNRQQRIPTTYLHRAS